MTARVVGDCTKSALVDLTSVEVCFETLKRTCKQKRRGWNIDVQES